MLSDKKCKSYTDKRCLFSFKGKNANFKKHGCLNLVALKTSSHVINKMSYQIVARKILGKVTKYDGVSRNIKKIMNVEI